MDIKLKYEQCCTESMEHSEIIQQPWAIFLDAFKVYTKGYIFVVDQR